MADRSVGMDVRALVVAWPSDAPRGAVSRFCREHGVSRSWFYAVRARADAEGQLSALSPRQRRDAARSPLAIPIEVEEAAVAIRKDLADRGWDHGPVTVRHHLERLGLRAPAASTLARLFTRRGMVTSQPQKRPHSAWRRFEFAAVHECWQLDSFGWPLADGSSCQVHQLEDDRSRYHLAWHIERQETTAGAMAVLEIGIGRFQVPHLLLTDNGSAFNTTRRGHEHQLVQHLAGLGCKAITGRPGHPQTQGKDERIHATTQRFLRAQPPAATIEELAAQMDAFADYYNQHRPHQSLAMATPAQALAHGPIAFPPQPQTPRHDRAIAMQVQQRAVNAKGKIRVRYAEILLGCEHARTRVTVVFDNALVNVFDAHGTHLRTQVLEPGKRYYGNGRPRSYRRNPANRPD